MKKYVMVSLVIVLLVGVLFTLYKYRAQNLSELLDMENVDKVHIITGVKDSYEFQLEKANQEKIDKLTQFLNQYQVKLTNKQGWYSNHESERFKIYLGYKNGEIEVYMFERNIVASTEIYEVVNPPFDYQWVKELEREFNSK